jgi:hypothetical protein
MKTIQTKKIVEKMTYFNWKKGIIFGKGGFLIMAFLLISMIFSFSLKSQAASSLELSMFVVDKENNKPLEGNKSIIFRIYQNQTNIPIWEETQQLDVNFGLIKTTLGQVNTLPTGLNSENNDYYLGVTIGNDIELEPRKRISPSLFAVSSVYSQTARSLNGSVIGENEGDIVVLGNGDVIDLNF